MKKITLRILAALLALLTLAVSLSACGETVSKKPDVAVLDALDATEKLAAKNPAAAFADTLGDTFTVEMNVNLSDLISSVMSASMGGISISLTNKVEMNIKEAVDISHRKGFATAALRLNDADFASVEEYVSAESIVLECRTLLGDRAYGLPFSGLTALVEKLGIPTDGSAGEVGKTAGAAFDAAYDAVQYLLANAAKLEKACDKYKKLSVETLFAVCNATRTKETVTVGNETAEAVVFTANVTSEDLRKVAETIYNTYNADVETGALVEGLLIAGGLTTEDIQTMLYHRIEEALAEPASTDDSAALRVEIGAKKGNLIRLSLADEGEPMVVTFGIDPANPKYAGIEVGKNGIVYRVTEETETARHATLTMSDGELDEPLVIDIENDLATGAFTISTKIADSDILLKGSLKSDKKSCTFTLDEVTAMGMVIKTGITVKITAGSETIPDAPAYKDISAMSEDEISDLGEAVLINTQMLVDSLPTELQFLLSNLILGS